MLRPALAFALVLSRPAFAEGALCDAAAAAAAADQGVPLALMQAITRVETGRDGVPWPWTLNIEGQGHWFATSEEATRAARRAVDDGAAQIDLGCFQLNLQWHGDAFATLEEMLDPTANAAHAARFLADLHAEFGDWRSAAAAYHSRTEDLGQAYVARLESAHAAATGRAADDAIPVAGRRNGFPLMAGGQGAGGSLVPRLSGIGPIIGGP